MVRITITVWLLLICTPVLSQGSAWVSEQQCAAHAPVGAWTFNGTILMTGYGGLHVLNTGWDTPRVVARIGRYVSGTLSPDGHWYASQKVNVIYSQSLNNEYDIEAIQVYSTLGDNVVHTIPWQNSWLSMGGQREMYWLDDTHILYESSPYPSHDLNFVVLNPFTGTTSPWTAQIDILDGGSGFNQEYVEYPSPDFTSTIYRRYSADGSARIWGLYDITTGTMRAELQSSTGPQPFYDAVFAWLPDSSGFVGEMPINADDTQLLLYDKNGDTKDRIFDLGPSRIGVPQNVHWSPDGRYLAFEPVQSSLVIADTRANQVIDICLSTAVGFAWSPDSTQIAFLQPGTGTQNVYVFDLPSWSYRAIGRQIVETAYWDQIVGWRSN